MTPTEDASLEDADTLLGKVIAANFRIDRLIGSGAMGNVYQGEQLSLGKAVAIKVLHPHLMSDDTLVRRFQREAKSASRLNHPNSIQIIDSGQDTSGTLYIAMELLAGRDLSQVIRDEFPLPVPRIVRIMSQVLSALDEAHAHGVIHRDLKPSNIMLIERRGEPDFVKVCDYGIAKAQMDDTQGETQMLTVQGLVCGTPEYMSPEQARGEPLDGRTDLYSASVILYHMITGDIPFRATTPIGIVSRHLSEAPVVPSSRRRDPPIPPDLDDLILRGLAKSRELRPSTAAEFREELEDIGTGGIGRRSRAVQKTVPGTQAIIDSALTAQLRAALPPPRHPRRGRALAISLMLVASASAVTLVSLRRSRISEPPVAIMKTSGASAAPSPRAVASGLAPPATPAAPDPGEAPNVDLVVPAAVSATPPAATSDRSGASGARDRTPQRKHTEGRAVPAPALGATTTGPGAPGPGLSAGHNLAPGSGASHAPAAAGIPGAQGPSETDDKSAAGVPVRGPREIVAEGEKLLSQGEVDEACRRGEDAKKVAPRLPTPYRFLGKCYMRAGDAARAKENYRRYLELSPGASDALFIESIVK
jgi:serine/threonine protein kinase